MTIFAWCEARQGWQILAFCAPFYFFSNDIDYVFRLEPGDGGIYRATVAMCQLVDIYNVYMVIAFAKRTAAMSYLSFWVMCCVHLKSSQLVIF